MQSLTYKDIIDDKVAEWQDGLKKLEEQAGTATSETKSKLIAQTNQIRSTMDKAIAQLRHLDEQETVDNTMETKDQIVKIFTSVDKNFIGHEGKSPFML